MTAAQAEQIVIEAYVDWCEKVDWPRPKADFGPFAAGYEAARESVAPLLEAARAYRDAAERYSSGRPHMTGIPLDRLLEAENALHTAARTFEASHVEGDFSQ
jgi:hypothetical protein